MWVGVWVVVFFNLRLGWSASGLIVPGYLVPLLIVKPLSAGVILLEAVLTYLVEQGISPERLEAKGFGEEKPIAPNNTRRGRAQNRRVEFIILEQ